MLFARALLSVGMLAASSSAAAADWWVVSTGGTGSDEHILFMDRSSIRLVGADSYTAWSYFINEKLDEGVRKTRSLHRYNCSERSMVLLSVSSYGNNDRLLRTSTYSTYEQKLRYAAPDTMGESALDFACTGPKADQKPLGSLSPDVYAGRWFKL